MDVGEENPRTAYCSICGRDKPDHDDDCPAKIGMKKFIDKYTGFTGGKDIGWGSKAKLDDPAFMLHQYRMNKLLIPRMTRKGIVYGPRDDKITERLVYEGVKFILNRDVFTIQEKRKNVDKAFIKFFARRSLRETKEKIAEELKHWKKLVENYKKKIGSRPLLEKSLELMSSFEFANLEESTILRPIRFHYLVNIQDKELADMWDNSKAEALSGLEEALTLQSDLSNFFGSIHASDYTEPGTPQGWKEIKITCTNPKAAQGVVERSKIVFFYTKILEGLTEWMKNSPRFECKLCYFGPMKILISPEPENVIPLSMLDPVVKKAWKMIDNELEEFKSTKWFKENYHRKET